MRVLATHRGLPPVAVAVAGDELSVDLRFEQLHLALGFHPPGRAAAPAPASITTYLLAADASRLALVDHARLLEDGRFWSITHRDAAMRGHVMDALAVAGFMQRLALLSAQGS